MDEKSDTRSANPSDIPKSGDLQQPSMATTTGPSMPAANLGTHRAQDMDRSFSHLAVDPTQEVDAPPPYPPPSYTDPPGGDPAISTDEKSYSPATQARDRAPPAPSGMKSLPCVVPQTHKSFRGAFFSPFVRAYAPDLAAYGIQEAEFLAFIDGLNESFVANPALQATGVLGGVMSMFYGIQPVQWAGLGLQVASGAGSAALSYARTVKYVKAVNATLFHEVGLHATVLSTKKMMEKVGYAGERLQLPPLETTNDLELTVSRHRERKQAKRDKKKAKKRRDSSSSSSSSSISSSSSSDSSSYEYAEGDDPRMRRIRALEGYVMPLNFNVPDAVSPDNLLRKMGHAQAQRLNKKQEKKMAKSRSKEEKKIIKHAVKADKIEEKSERSIDREQRGLDKLEAKIEQGDTSKKTLKEREKQEKRLRKAVEKGEKDTGKGQEKSERVLAKSDRRESRVAHKIRWVVISAWDGDEGEESGDEEEDVATEEVDRT